VPIGRGVPTETSMAAKRSAQTVLEPTELLIRVLENRTDAAAFRAYGDWLEQHGDPRGELIALQMMMDTGVPFDDLDLRRYTASYLWRHRSLVPKIDPWRTELDWKWGFIVGVSIVEPTLRELEHLLAHPSCVMLESITAHRPTRDMEYRLEALHPQLEISIYGR